MDSDQYHLRSSQGTTTPFLYILLIHLIQTLRDFRWNNAVGDKLFKIRYQLK